MTDHPQEHASLDAFADKVEASGYDKLRKPLGYISAWATNAAGALHRASVTIHAEADEINNLAIYTQPQLDALIAEARAEERERCLQAVETIMQSEKEARDASDIGVEQMSRHRYAVLVCIDVKEEIRKDHP